MNSIIVDDDDSFESDDKFISKDEWLEHLKYRNRVKEILIDKLVLAVVLGAFAFYGNMLVLRYERHLDDQLNELRENYAFRRLIAEREVKAYENIWSALVEFRGVTNGMFAKPLDDAAVQAVTAAALEVTKATEREQIYLDDETEKQLHVLWETEFPAFINKWGSDPETNMSRETWNLLANATTRVGTVLQTAIQRKKSIMAESKTQH